MRKVVVATAVIVFVLASAAPAFGATFSQRPPATNPSGTAAFSFTVASDGGAGANGWVAYKLPDGAWQRCKEVVR